MSESSLWSYLRNGMRGRWHAIRHEDKLNLGVPDVSYGLHGINGWLELKALYAWPKRETTFVPVNLSREQKEWLTARGRFGGNCWVLLRVRRDYLLYGWTSAKDLGFYDRQCLLTLAVKHWVGAIDFDEFEIVLSS